MSQKTGLAHNSVHVEVEVVELSAIGVRICDVDWDSDFISVGILNLDLLCLYYWGDYMLAVRRRRQPAKEGNALILGYFLLSQRKRAGTPYALR